MATALLHLSLKRKVLLPSLAQAVSSGLSAGLRRSRVGSVPGAGGRWVLALCLAGVVFIHPFRAGGNEHLHAGALGASRLAAAVHGSDAHSASSRASHCQPPPAVTGGRWEQHWKKLRFSGSYLV